MILQNGGGDKRGVTGAALAAVRAGLAGDELPAPWAPPAATAISAATTSSARTRVRTAERSRSRKDEDGLSISIGSVSARLERDPLVADPGESFLAAHPAFERFLLEFRSRRSGTGRRGVPRRHLVPRRAYEGPTPRSRRRGGTGIPGIYRNDDPWSAVLRDRPPEGPAGDPLAHRRERRGGRRAHAARRRVVRGRRSRASHSASASRGTSAG